MDCKTEIKKSSGFKSEKIIVLPRNFLGDVSQHPLANAIYPTDTGFFPAARFHYRERAEGCEQYILIYCIDGEGFFVYDGKRREISKNSLIVIPKGSAHIYGASEKNPWSILWVHFAGVNAQHYICNVDAHNPVLTIPIDKSAKIRQLFVTLISTLEKGYAHNSFIYASQVLAGLLGLIFFADTDHNIEMHDDSLRIEESINFMCEHLNRNLKLDTLAAQVSLSPAHYSYLFKKKTGFSPIDYFLRLKVQKACQYLDMSGMKIKEISTSLGFNDPYYFSRAFRKIMLISPTDYKKVKKG